MTKYLSSKYWLKVMLLALLGSNAFAQTCPSALVQSTPTSDFTLHDDGTVTHKKTSLMWQVCTLGQTWNNDNTCTDSPTMKMNWLPALTAASDNVDFGYTDWRLPNIKELLSIVETSCHDPIVNSSIFNNNKLDYYWTSSPVITSSGRALALHFGKLVFENAVVSGEYYVRLVRDAD